MSSVSSGRVYFEVIDYIKRLVGEGKVRFGEKLPSEREMMETLGLSRNSIREAMRTLEHMGMTESRQGKGNFLAVSYTHLRAHETLSDLLWRLLL